MVYNTGNGASLQKLPNFRKKMLEIEKKESKTINTFQKILEQINQRPQYNQSRQGYSSRENV